MGTRLCIDVETDHIKGGLFEETKCLKTFKLHDPTGLKANLEGVSIEDGLVVSNDPAQAYRWCQLLVSMGIDIKPLEREKFLARAAPEAKDLLLPNTIAKIYGALSLYPSHDCLVIDFGTTIRYELISKQGLLLGRCAFPFFDLLYRSLDTTHFNFEDQVPRPIGLNPTEAIISGCFFGLLGSVERIISEIRLYSPHPTELITLATGSVSEKPCWKNPVCELVDHFHPNLVLEGLNHILNEGLKP